MTLILDKVPQSFSKGQKTMHFADFADQFLDYMQDMQDRKNVKKAQEENTGWTSLKDLKSELGV